MKGEFRMNEIATRFRPDHEAGSTGTSQKEIPNVLRGLHQGIQSLGDNTGKLSQALTPVLSPGQVAPPNEASKENLCPFAMELWELAEEVQSLDQIIQNLLARLQV